MPTIFVIDDDISALSSIVSTLSEARYEVQQARSIDQARHYLDETDPDLILLEVDIEQSKGWDLLRDITRFDGPPTIVVSHRGREEEIVQARDIGAIDFLPKPFRTNELLARVRTRLGVPPAVEEPSTPPASRTQTKEDDTPVFMGQADESHLFRSTEPVTDGFTVDESLPLGARFRMARQGRKLSLVQINLETKIPIWYLQAIEEEKFSLLPRGDSAAQMVQTYAEYLRIDVERAVTEYRANYDSGPFRQLNSLGGPPPREIPMWTSILIAALLALVIGIGILWYVAGDQMMILGDNLRNLVTNPTGTLTPPPTP